MSDAAQWEQGNERFLSAALAWLRLRLARLAGASEPDETALAEAALNAANALDPPPALLILGRRLGLSLFEQQILLLCASVEFDTRIPALCARAQDDAARLFPTFALAMALFDDPAWEALSPARPLRYWRLIEINQPGAQPLISSALRADERIVSYLKGLNELDDRLMPLLAPLESTLDAVELPPSQHAAVEQIVCGLRLAPRDERPPLVQLVGPDSMSKQLVAEAAAAALGLQLYRLPAELLPAQSGELELFDRLWQRESMLLPVALYLDAGRSADPAMPALNRLLSRSGALIVLDSREVLPELGRPTLVLDIARPTVAEQRDAWVAATGSDADHPRQANASRRFHIGQRWCHNSRFD